jgi:hypothetical protein
MHMYVQGDQIGPKIVGLVPADMARLPPSIITKIYILVVNNLVCQHLLRICFSLQGKSSVFYQCILHLINRFLWFFFSAGGECPLRKYIIHTTENDKKFRTQSWSERRAEKYRYVPVSGPNILRQLFCQGLPFYAGQRFFVDIRIADRQNVVVRIAVDKVYVDIALAA